MSEKENLQLLYRLPEEHLSTIVQYVRDWQYQHGSLLQFPPRSGKIIARPIGATLFPSNFPKRCYDEACNLQPLFNKLYAAIAEDEKWLYENLKALIESPNSMAHILWNIHSAIKEDGRVQDLSLGIFRNDYMLHASQGTSGGMSEELPLEIKQVEFNAYSVAGGAHGNRISDMHRYLDKIGVYGADYSTSAVLLPSNKTVKSITASLAKAHVAYGPAKSDLAACTAVLMVVQPNNVNICDERPFEEALWEEGIPSYRVEFGDAVLASTVLTDSREMLFLPTTSHTGQRVEVSVIYQRAGYDVEEYTQSGLEARYQLERSRAIKAPSLLSQMTTLKVVQQKLTLPHVLERFLDDDEAARMRKTFMPIYSLDNSPLGEKGLKLALSSNDAVNYVLKPSLEGGGHNIYRESIPSFLRTISQSQIADYVLMEMIKSPDVHNALLNFDGLYSGPVISELGVFGTCLWRRDAEGKLEFLENSVAGTSLKTKRTDVDEISVVKGYGCFDSPCLI